MSTRQPATETQNSQVVYAQSPKEWRKRPATPAEAEHIRAEIEKLDQWRRSHPGQEYPPTLAYIVNG